MYINFNLLSGYGLIPGDVIILQAISQNRIEDNSVLLDEICDRLDFYEKQDLVRYIKGAKKDSQFKLIRLSEKGSRILEEIQIPNLTQDDIDVAEWIKKVYIKAEKEIGNFKNLKLHTALFRVHSGIERNHLAKLISTFINDEENFKYSVRADYLIWKPENLFQTKFDINQSRLYSYYLKRKEYFDNVFLKISN